MIYPKLILYLQEIMAMLPSSDEIINGTKLMRLILEGGTEALRNVFQGHHPGELKVVLYSKYHILSKLKGRIINQKQWDKLYPTPPEKPDINEFDITLLCVLLRNICGLSPPSSGWDKMPNVSDHTREADIIRIKLFRNERFGHIPKTAVSMADFIKFSVETSAPLVRLGIDQKEIDRLANEKYGEEEVSRVLMEWSECDDKIMNALKNIEDGVNVLTEKSETSQMHVLNKLLWCDFQTEINEYNLKFTEGTRQWVFEQVSNWFNDNTSEKRVFVVSGHAGMGKSIIAAAICKRFAEHVGACHFFQYNNDQYNNPKFFLQSLAWHLCKALPTYKDALVEKLSGNLGKSLNEKNIEGLFSTLLKEPLCRIEDPGKHIMIVLDAIDESEYNERQDFANLIARRLHKLPSYIRFVITTRPVENLLNTFVKLNPLYIEPDDKRNLNDLKLVLSEKIRSPVSADLIDILAKMSQGVMLYAFFLTEIYQGDYSMHELGSLPKGIEEHYENYFQRLELELKNSLEISDEKFLSFLSALVVAKESLPEAFAAAVFGFEQRVDAKRKTAIAINALSSLLVIHEDKSLSFFHKSVRDWLVDNTQHNYCVNVQYGHMILFELCVKKLNDVKERGFSKESLAFPDVKYAFKYCISHMLKGLEDAGRFESFVSDYFTDLEVVYAGVCVNVNLALDNLKSLQSPESSDELQRFLQNPDDSWLSRVGQVSDMLYSFAIRYIPLSNKSVLVFSCDTNVLRVFNIDALMRTNFTHSNAYEFEDLDVSTNGDFVYLNDWQQWLTVTKLEDESSQFYSRPKYSKYVFVKDGIISYIRKGPCTPVLWNSDFTQQLYSFDQLAGTIDKCLSVSDEVIACAYDQKCVKFFNVSTQQIVHEMSIDERDCGVCTCSIKYHALTVWSDGKNFMWKDGKKIDAWTNLFWKVAFRCICYAEFSPNGNTLALTCIDSDRLLIFDVLSTSMLAKISFAQDCGGLKFLDDKNLICSFLQTIYCINVKGGEILACLDLGIWPFPISVCRKLNIVCAWLRGSGNFQLLEVILPRV